MTLVNTGMDEYKGQQLRWLSEQNQVDTNETEALLSKLTKTQLQAAGLAILGLYPTEYKTCFGGRIAVDFSPDQTSSDGRIKKSAIKTGDVVSVEAAGLEEGKISGTVHRMSDSVVSVIFETDPEIQGPVRLVKRGNPIVFERMTKAVKSLTFDNPIVRLLFDPNISELEYQNDIPNLQIEHLNEQQQHAVKRAVTATHLAIIHGPPGTGKTQCIAAIVKSLVGKRVLLTAASNLAVDNMVERVVMDKGDSIGNIIRIGHPARLTEAVMKHSLDYQLSQSDQGQIIVDIKRDINRQLSLLKTARKGKRDVYRELRELRQELRKREEKRLDELLSSKSIVLATTLNGAAGRTVTRHAPFDVCIIDEASQALQAETWIAATLAKKVVIVGDHHQLPPTTDIVGLKETLFDRLIRKFPKEAIMLQRQ